MLRLLPRASHAFRSNPGATLRGLKFSAAELASFDKAKSSPLKTPAYVVESKGAPFKKRDVTLPALKDSAVEIEITHCGLCLTDVHMQNNDWGVSTYPLVAGHEGVGVIRAVGAGAKHLKPGQRVGVGWIRDSCKVCPACLNGKDNHCAYGYEGTYLGKNAGIFGKQGHNDQGCFAKVVRIEERFAFPIPDNISSAEAAPLMCAGITTWEPIADYVTPGCDVAVVGMGGLGHMALQLAQAAGARVVGVGRGSNKKQRVLEIGAADYIDSTSEKDFAKFSMKFDLVLDTTPAVLDTSKYLGLLKFGGSFVKVGLPEAGKASFSHVWTPWIFMGQKIAGSIVSGSKRTNQMLHVCGSHCISAKVCERPFSKLNETAKELHEGKNQNFRFVLTADW